MSAFVTMSKSTNFSISFSPSTKKIHYFLFSPFLSHHSFIRITLDCSNISCKNIVFIQLHHPFKKPIAKPADIPLVSGIPKFIRPYVSILLSLNVLAVVLASNVIVPSILFQLKEAIC